MPYDTRLNHIESQIEEFRKAVDFLEKLKQEYGSRWREEHANTLAQYKSDLKYWEAELIRHKQRRQRRGVKY